MALGVMLITLLVLFILNVPIAFAMIVSMSFYFILSDTFTSIVLIQRMVGSMESVPLLAIIFFLAVGILMNYTGITSRMLNFAQVATNRLPGSLAQVNILLSTLMGGLSGSNIADSAMQSKILVPKMVENGYSKSFSAALTASTSLITGIIPPSIGLIMFGYIGKVSIGDLFLAGILPGIALCFTFMIYVHFYVKKHKIETERKPKITKKYFFFTLKDASLAILLPLIIIGGIRFGAFSATEAGAIAILYTLILGLVIYREMKMSQLVSAFLETVYTASSVLIIIAAGSAFAWILTLEQIPQTMTTLMVEYVPSKFIFFIVVFLFLIVVGMFVEGNITIIVLTPLFMPMLPAYGIDSVHFGIFFVLTVAIGSLTPPLGTVMYTTSSITGTKIEDFIKASIPFLILLGLYVLLLAYVPAVSLWLPSLFE